MKKRIGFIGFILLFLLILGISAYLTDKKTVDNMLTVGSVESQIEEQFTIPTNLNKGTVVDKEVKVTNTGRSDCYVRVYVSASSNPDYFKINTAAYADRDISSEKAWYYDTFSGYYYYKKSLASGKTTTPLFDSVEILKDMNELSEEDVQIIVYEEAIQANGNDDCVAAFQ